MASADPANRAASSPTSAGAAWTGRTTFGRGWAVYEGPCGDAVAHQHYAVQLVVGTAEPVTVDGAAVSLTGEAVLIKSGARHRIRPGPQSVRVVFVQADTGLAADWGRLCGDCDLTNAPAALREIVAHARRLGDVVGDLARAAPDLRRDRRLTRALIALSEQPHGAGAIAQAARAGGVSVSRLRALAAAELTAPLTHWRLWRMLECAVGELRAGHPAAVAAQNAGFSDQAHLIRTARRLLGITPSTLIGTL